MTQAAFDARDLDRLLDTIEASEQRALKWGYTGAFLTEDEIVRMAEDITGNREDAEAFVVALLDRALVVELRDQGGAPIYRSRFAEAVRLLISLRQLLPWRPSWTASPRLVSDFRIDRRPRRFPSRDQAGKETLARLAEKFSWSPVQRSIASALIATKNGPLSLAGFQVRAMEHLFENKGRDAGVVIAAGTGSGKTMAYYLPAFVAIGEQVRSASFWTKSVSIYPRNELLKDQFTEAFRLARRVSPLLPRPLRLATFFGPTPGRISEDDLRRDWQTLNLKSGEAFICPFLVCPECDRRLLWRLADVQERRERLVCEGREDTQNRCSFASDPAEVALTRDTARAQPPDALFTTAEMLNQRISDPESRPLFGLGARNKPSLLLLDEVHTYEGTSGAHTALMLRRWRHGVGAPVLRVGLSATLTDAPNFFAQVSGVRDFEVTEVTPAAAEYENDSAEYQLAIRGDPVSQVALLSTSIQASFLMARVLDTSEHDKSEGRFGQRAFVFTDDLDVTNRLFDDLRDAEGVGGRTPRLPLAAMHERKAGDRLRFEGGQDWRAIEAIGWDLRQSLDVSRTSSRDAGVDRGSQIVVATASLEVGYNDNRVGAVVQHKAPYRASSFVQRKGRAGRTRRMRPWTLTVLSDYGRDRLAYQAYHTLFDAFLPPQRLPVENGYVQRIHAGFATIEWLASRFPALRAWWWWAVNGPSTNNWVQAEQKKAEEEIEKLLGGDEHLLASLHHHLENALRLSGAQVESILWEPPRSLLLELLPTLLRRLQTTWKLAQPVNGRELDLVSQGGPPHPLPEFLPPNLFTDLNLPEVTIVGPGVDLGESLRVEQALRHLAPGRITRRFAHRAPGLYHWIPVPLDLGDEPYRLTIDAYATDYRPVALAPVEIDGTVRQVQIYRPWLLTLAEALTSQSRSATGPRSGRADVVSPNSNAFLVWSSQLIPSEGEAIRHRPEYDRRWRNLLTAIDFHMHSERSPVLVRRFALEARADVRIANPRQPVHPLFVKTMFCEPRAPDIQAAVGFEAEVDAVCFRFDLPAPDVLAKRAEAAASARSWRTAYMADLIQRDRALPAAVNSFLRDWLKQIYLSALIALADERGVSLSEANEFLVDLTPAPFSEVMDGIFHVRVDPDEVSADDRLRTDLVELLNQREIVQRLAAHAATLWEEEPEGWAEWLHGALHETLGQCAALACLEVAPQHVAEDSLILDLDRGIPDEAADVTGTEAWLSESSIGGAGSIEAIARTYAQEPRRILRALEAAFAEGDSELTSRGMVRVLRLSRDDLEVQAALAAVRVCHGQTRRETALQALYRLLATRSVFVDHALSVGLNQRILREGSDATTDQLLADLVGYWDDLERHLGIAIDLRVFCYLAVRSPAFGPRIQAMISGGAGQAAPGVEAVGVLSGLLLPLPGEIRQHTLQSYSPYRDNSFSDPALVRELLFAGDEASVRMGEADWEDRLREALAAYGRVDLVAESSALPEFQEALIQVVATPVDDGFLQFYPSIEKLRYVEDAVAVSFVLRTFS